MGAEGPKGLSPPPAQLLISVMQLGEEEMTQVLRAALQNRPWLRSLVAVAFGML